MEVWPTGDGSALDAGSGDGTWGGRRGQTLSLLSDSGALPARWDQVLLCHKRKSRGLSLNAYRPTRVLVQLVLDPT